MTKCLRTFFWSFQMSDAANSEVSNMFMIIKRPGMAAYLLLLGLQQENTCVTSAGSVE